MDSLNEKLNQFKLPLVLCLVGVVLIIGGVFSSGLLDTKPPLKVNPPGRLSQQVAKLNSIKIDISGAVLNPGVYTLAGDSRIEDVIKAAGGFTASSSAEYISKSLNLSQKISDGMKIYIPFIGEPLSSFVSPGVVDAQVAGISSKIGINSASQKQLEDLPGVGPATALKIISSRPYQSLDELLNKKAVGRSVYEKIKGLVDLN